MLLRVSFQNILSFYEKTEFDMFPNPKREILGHHINDKGKVPLLKHALVYGANGSGKSNFVKVLQFIKSFVVLDDFLDKVNLEDYCFQLISDNNEPIKIEVEFCSDNKYYIYGVEINHSPRNEIREYLSLSGVDEDDEMIFERVGNNVTPTTNSSLSEQLLDKNPSSSMISLNKQYPVVDNDDLAKVYDWFLNDLKIVTINTQTPFLIDMMSKNEQLLVFANKLLSNLRITDSLNVEETPIDKWMLSKKNSAELRQILQRTSITDNSGLSAFSNNRNNFNITLKDGEQIVQEFLFEQSGVGGYKRKMDISTQSDGTVRLLTLIPALYEAKEGKTVVIDEVENSMHPMLIYEMLRYFFNSESDGQLVCTTHLTQLQDQQELVRPDELWKVEKENGNSVMSSFNDYKIHNTMNIRKGYEEGRYGGVPQISSID